MHWLRSPKFLAHALACYIIYLVIFAVSAPRYGHMYWTLYGLAAPVSVPLFTAGLLLDFPIPHQWPQATASTVAYFMLVGVFLLWLPKSFGSSREMFPNLELGRSEDKPLLLIDHKSFLTLRQAIYSSIIIVVALLAAFSCVAVIESHFPQGD